MKILLAIKQTPGAPAPREEIQKAIDDGYDAIIGIDLTIEDKEPFVRVRSQALINLEVETVVK